MVVGKQVKDCWGKKGLGKMKKEKMVFPLLIFSQILSFYIFSQQPVFPLILTWILVV